jgi:hypothetical protein
MKRTLLLTAGIFFLFFITAFCQEQGKSPFFRNQIGIQFNPYINEQFFNFKMMNTVAALRYGYRITKNITTGMEFSCIFPVNISSGQSFDYFSYGIGLLTRYSILSERRFQIFAEASPYYKHSNMEGDKTLDYKFNQFGVYVAPGVSLYSKSKNFSFDLYYKFSNLTLVNGKKSVLSYKINYFF